MFALFTFFIAIQASFAVPARAENLLTSVEEVVASALQVVSVSGLFDFLDSIPLGTVPANEEDTVLAINQALNDSQAHPVAFAGLLKNFGAFPEDYVSLSDIVQQLSGCGEPCSDNNTNTREPSPSVYTPVPGDAPWSQSEADLRKALYFPPGYTYGAVTPLVMVPGTGMFAESQKSCLHH